MASTWHDIKKHISRTTKKDAYVCLSFILLVLLLGAVIWDYIYIYVNYMPEDATQNLVRALLFFHCVGIYIGILGFVHITQTMGRVTTKATVAVGIICAHVLVFTLRVALEITAIHFRKERYQT